jgi:hypothetical protein
MSRKPSDPATRLERLRERIEYWRATRARKSPMPPALWEEAAALAHEIDEFTVRRTLRLNAESLRSRLVPALPAEGDLSPAFVRLESLARPDEGVPMVVELSDSTGATLRLQLSAGASLDVAGIISAFLKGRS